MRSLLLDLVHCNVNFSSIEPDDSPEMRGKKVSHIGHMASLFDKAVRDEATGECRNNLRYSVLESVALRFLQIQVCVIYGYSGFEKLKGTLWWRGEAVWYALANSQIARFDFSWLSRFPLLIVIATYTTVLWEVYFPILVWLKPIRKYVLLFGILLHLSIAFTVCIPFFGALMISTYILFLDEDELKRLSRALTNFFSKLKV